MGYVLSLCTVAQIVLARLHGFMSVAVTTLHLIPGPVAGAAALAWLRSSLLMLQVLVLAFAVVVSKPALPQFREPASPCASSRLPLPVTGKGNDAFSDSVVTARQNFCMRPVLFRIIKIQLLMTS